MKEPDTDDISQMNLLGLEVTHTTIILLNSPKSVAFPRPILLKPPPPGEEGLGLCMGLSLEGLFGRLMGPPPSGVGGLGIGTGLGLKGRVGRLIGPSLSGTGGFGLGS